MDYRNTPAIKIETIARKNSDKGIRTTVYLGLLDGGRVLEFQNEKYDINNIILSWKYSFNLSGLTSHEYTLGFTELLDIISVLRLPTTKLSEPWYVRIGMLLKTLS